MTFRCVGASCLFPHTPRISWPLGAFSLGKDGPLDTGNGQQFPTGPPHAHRLCFFHWRLPRLSLQCGSLQSSRWSGSPTVVWIVCSPRSTRRPTCTRTVLLQEPVFMANGGGVFCAVRDSSNTVPYKHVLDFANSGSFASTRFPLGSLMTWNWCARRSTLVSKGDAHVPRRPGHQVSRHAAVVMLYGRVQKRPSSNEGF